ncbi:MAG: type IV pilus assembly protein PilM [Candidatus Coatesbacteria bacterium]
MAGLTGLDLGSRSFKAVGVNMVKDGYTLAGIGYQDLPFPEEDTQAEQLLLENLKRFIKEGGVKMKDVAVALSGEHSNLRAQEMPKMGKEELRNVLPYEIEQYLPINPEESVIDFEIQGDSKADPSKMSVLLAAGRLEAAEAMYKVTEQVKLNCRVIDIDDLALTNMFQVNYAWEDDYKKVICLLNVGNRITSVIIFEDGEFRFNKPITIGGEMLTKDIQREFALKSEQAEDLKKEQAKVVVEDASSFSLSMFDREDRSLRIYETISGSLNKLLAEVKRCFDFYDTQYKGRSVERILLCGGGSKLKEFDRFLSDKLGVAVEFADPFRQIRVPAKGTAAALVEQHSPAFGVAVGLALRRAG